MNSTTSLIFEKYQIRKTKKQKTAFINWMRDYSSSLGYNCTVEKASLGARNIVIGNPEAAKAVFTAHYDTCPVMPFPNFITPKCFTFYLLYQFFITFVILTVSFAASEIIRTYIYDIPALEFIFIYGLLFLLMFGPANKHTANDNTSGVTTVIDIMTKLPEDCRDSVAFILFDMEEVGLIGSASYYKKHKKQMKKRLLINFDCVSDGKEIIVYAPKKASQFNNILSQAFVSENGITVQVLNKGVFYPSDQMNYPCGVGVAAFRKTKRNLLYMDKIHTNKDCIYDEENISYLCNASIKLIRSLSEK